MTEYVYTSPTFTHGNRCGHMPAYPTLYERSPDKKKTYDIIHTAHEHLKDYYWQPTDYLASIRHSRFHVDGNQIYAMKQQRSESREVTNRVLGLLADYCDLETMTAIHFKDGKREPVSLLFVAMFLGIKYQRVARVIKLLKKSHLIEVEHRSCYIGGKFVKIVAIKHISRRLFRELGISQLKIEEAIHYARTKHEKREKKQEIVPRIFTAEPMHISSLINPNQSIPSKEESIASCKAILDKFKKPPS